MSVGELKHVFSELKIYEYLTVLKGGKPIGVVFRSDVERISREDLTAGELNRIAVKIRDFNLEREGLIGIIELLPVIREPIIVTDRRGKYVGLITYDVLLHYITKYREYVIPLVQQIRESLGKEVFLYVFGIKNLKGFRERFGYEKTKGLLKILREDVQEVFGGDIEEVEESEEVWVLSRKPPEKESVKELFEEFFKEYSLLFGDFPDVSLYGMSVNLKFIESQEQLFKKIKELRERAKKIQGYIFVVHGLQPKLILYDPRKRKLLKNIKERILRDFSKIVEEVVSSPQDIWEFVLYDMFKKYPYFELFYIISSSGLQISNNVVNPNVDYFIAQGKKGTDRSDRAYFRETLEKGEYISDIYLSRATDDFCITVAKRFEYNGKVYILAGDINFREIHRLIKESMSATNLG
ncbi:MAG: glycine dehydrogenase [Aquificae bacterium]|nr:glycine dehydrogenase [Aquificota bacterium]